MQRCSCFREDISHEKDYQLTIISLFNIEFILVSLLILLLAQVWSYGLELKRDQELTI